MSDARGAGARDVGTIGKERGMRREWLWTGVVFGLSVGCGGEEATPTPEEIHCAILSPGAAAVACGRMSVQIGLDGPVARVELLAGEAVVATADVPEPMRSVTVEWDTTAVEDGAATLTARAFDPEEREARSEAVTVVVDNTAPVVAMGMDRYALIRGIGPVALAIEDATLATVRVASDLAGVVYDGPVDPAAPAFHWDTTTVEDRIHRLTVTATDAAGHSATLRDFPVIVANHGEEYAATYDPSAQVYVPEDYRTVDFHTRGSVPTHPGVFRIISRLTWDPAAGWMLQYTLGEGLCPHRGIPFVTQEGDAGEIVIELSYDMLPSTTVRLFPDEVRRPTTFPSNDDPATFGTFFGHVAPLEPADHVGQRVPIRMQFVLIDEPPPA